MPIDYSKLPRDEFRCPKCGGSFFARGGDDDDDVACHDQMQQGCHWHGPVDQCMRVSDEVKLAFVEELLEKAEAKLDFYLLIDRPWTTPDVLKKLADAADHLLREHDCDCHGHEEIAVARDVARAVSKALEKLHE